jgi:hypothetical protein
LFVSRIIYVMRIISGLIRLDTLTTTRCRSTLMGALALTAITLSTGCNKSKSPTAQAPPPVTDTNLAAADLPGAPVSTPPPVEIVAKPDGGVDLKALNHAYIGWIVQTRKAPKSFEEYVSLSGVKVPPPPAGKKYVIDKNGFINVANQ